VTPGTSSFGWRAQGATSWVLPTDRFPRRPTTKAGGLRSPDRWFGIAIGMILGGGIGNNPIDRVRFGSVVDFTDMGIGNSRWYTYNLADAFAVAGVIMLLAHEFLGWGKAKPDATAGSKPAAPSGSGQD
jgi:hypothetical protein